MSNLENAKVIAKMVGAYNFLNNRIREADNRGVAWFNVQGIYIPVEKGSAVYNHHKANRDRLLFEIENSFNINHPPLNDTLLSTTATASYI